MDQGATIGCDRFGLDMFNPTEDWVATIVALDAQGCSDRIVLGHDASCYIDVFAAEQAQEVLKVAALTAAGESAPCWPWPPARGAVLGSSPGRPVGGTNVNPRPREAVRDSGDLRWPIDSFPANYNYMARRQVVSGSVGREYGR
jgi:hypothetical protein